VGGFGGKSDQLNHYNVFLGDPGCFTRDLERYRNADGGRIRYVQTALEARPVRFVRDVFRHPTADPDLIVTDYEPITAWMARRRGLRSVGIGHLYSFAWPQVPRAPGNLITRSVLTWFAPAAIPVGMHWDAFGAPVLPPPVAPEIRALGRGSVEPDLILVYLAFEPLGRLVPLLKQFPRYRFHVYTKVAEERTDQNVAIRPISRAKFVTDLGQCAGVITNAGFSLTSECLHLGIAVLVKPIDGHLEQESNALALERLGVGTVSRRLSRNDLLAWLEQKAPAARCYPDVTAGIVQWLNDGAVEPLSALSDRLWAMTER